MSFGRPKSTPFFGMTSSFPSYSLTTLGLKKPGQVTPFRCGYAAYYNESRTHRFLNNDAPFHRAIERLGAITSHPVLGGLHHEYCRI